MGKILLKIVESYYFQSVSWRTLQIILSPIKWRNEKKWPKQNYFENTKIFSFFWKNIEPCAFIWIVWDFNFIMQ